MSQERGRGVAGWLAFAAALFSVPLVLFGGSVTTLGAGMAVEGWLVAEGHFLLFFPVESWFRDTATFVEHTHRLFGVLVGLCAVGACVASFTSQRSPQRSTGARILATVALLAVCAQGALGGFRVLEDAPSLAFLHGAAAQAVFALLCASALVQGRAWREPRTVLRDRTAPSDLLLAAAATLAVYGQVVLGAWYRHALRSTAAPEAGGRFVLHVLGAFGVVVLVLAFAGACQRAAERAVGGSSEERALSRSGRRLVALVGLQVLLGLIAWAGYRPGAVGPLEWTLSILHVLGGGLLLAQTLGGWMWLRRSQPVDAVAFPRDLAPSEAR